MQNENGQGQRVYLIRPVMNTVPGETRVYRSKEEALKEFGGDPLQWVKQEEPNVWETPAAPRWDRDSHEHWMLEQVILRGSRDQNPGQQKQAAKTPVTPTVPAGKSTPKATP